MNIYGKLLRKLKNILRRSNTMTKWLILSVWLHTYKSPSIIYCLIKIEDGSHMIISTDAEQ